MSNDVSQYYTPGIQTATNFKEFFLKHDALENASSQVLFSIYGKYRCRAGCKMCYLQNQWVTDEEFERLVPTEITPEVEAKILQFFDYFSDAVTIDDFNQLSTKYPHLLGFYERNSHRMWFSSMSDVAFIQQQPILVSGRFKFKGVYEVTFSDLFLAKKNGQFVDDLIDRLDAVLAVMPIIKLKVIICTEGGEKAEQIQRLVAWAHDKNIFVGLHDDFMQGKNRKLSLEVADYQEGNYYANQEIPYTILTETTHMQLTDVYLSLVDATRGNTKPYYDIMSADLTDPATFLRKMLQAKVEIYDRYVSEIGLSCENKIRDYYSYIVNSLHINPDFNFIPAIVIKPWYPLYKLLQDQGFLAIKHGLYKPREDGDVIPMFSLAEPNKRKINHIPIKTVLVKAQA